MERIKIFQVDAFTDKLFHGNPAAVCLLQEWLNDELLQAIALENNLSETAYVVENEDGYHIRWFSPNGEVDLCGHATLAAADVLFSLQQTDKQFTFSSLSGPLYVRKDNQFIEMDFPLMHNEQIPNQFLEDLINQPIIAAYCSPKDWLVILDNEERVKQTQVDQIRLLAHDMQGLIVSAPSDDVDFYSRCFYPKHKIPEDPVTGSAHCLLTPVWAERLGKSSFVARQGLSRKGTVHCQLNDNRVLLKGECRRFMEGTIEL
ncbi:PhzF family phenazine biosynthesis protein [Legionella sp. W05-934-2]|jgi:predicted PhzF superfamily epimerase YddE/YHI9|uniref:PhzF family phenazine biosynthesis protein n=1 Tax=Legionella sp. W05-934-2 TaxID=1198649 RepID=UPI0034626933